MVGRREVVVVMVVMVVRVVVVVEVVDGRVVVARRCRHPPAGDVPLGQVAGEQRGAAPVVGGRRPRRPHRRVVLRHADGLSRRAVGLLAVVAGRRALAVAVHLECNLV